MSVKKQLATLKENWLMIVLGLVVLVFISGGSNVLENSFDSAKSLSRGFDGGYAEMASDSYYPGSSGGNFAPEVEERKITKTSSLSTETPRGEFVEDEERLKNIISSSGAYLLNERVNRNGEGWRGYFYGSYSLKVDTSKYEAVVSQLKEIGEVQSFNENMADVTGRYDDLSVELEVEKQRLVRYLEMFDEAEETEYKIDLNDRIFDQERRLAYIESSLENLDNRVDYSSISFSMSEERSDWTDIVLVKISSLVRGFVDSLNMLLGFLFGVLPWAVAGWLVWVVWRKVRPQTA